MHLFEITNSEDHPVYQALEISNVNRQYDFLRSIVDASIQMGRPFLSNAILKALNFQAITCLHVNAGEFRPCAVTVGSHIPPQHFRVQALMDDFINQVNKSWDAMDPVALATFVLWRINYIHPFINGNGRTARAACYFVLCVKANGWLPGDVILPTLLSQNREEYVAAHEEADASVKTGDLDLSRLHSLIVRLLDQQIPNADPN